MNEAEATWILELSWLIFYMLTLPNSLIAL